MKLAWTLLILLLAGFAQAYPYLPSDTEIQDALQYLNYTQSNDGSIGGISDTAYAVMAIQAAGGNASLWNKTGKTPIDYLMNQSYEFNSSTSPTTYSITILALNSAGINSSDVFGKDLISELENLQNADGHFGLWFSDHMWAVLALFSSDYYNSTVLDSSRDYLLNQQKSDGGFTSWGTTSNADETSHGLWAMMAAGLDPSSVEVEQALSRLHSLQDPSGGFTGWSGPSGDSTCWSMPGISRLNSTYNYPTTNISPSERTGLPGTNATFDITLTKSSPFDFVVNLQHSDGSFLATTTSSPDFFSIQRTSNCIISLLGKTYPISIPPHSDTELNLNLAIQREKEWDYTLSTEHTLNLIQTSLTVNVSIPQNATEESATFTLNLTHSNNPHAVYSTIFQINSILPDLTVSATYPSSIQINNQIEITSTVQNQGSDNATNFNVSFYVNNQLHESTLLNATGNSSIEKKFYYTPTSAGTYSFLIAADLSNTLNEISDSNNNFTFSVQVTNPPQPSNSGGSPSFTTSISNPNSQSKTISKISAGAISSAEFTKEIHSVTQIKVKAAEDILNLKLTAENKGTKNPKEVDPKGISYKYLSLTKNIENSKIENIDINFKVPKSWIGENNIDASTIILNRHSEDQWQKLLTEKQSEDSEYLYFRASTPGFSIFAITGEEKAEPEPQPEPAPAPETQPAAVQEPELKDKIPPQAGNLLMTNFGELSFLKYFFIFLLVILFLALSLKYVPKPKAQNFYKIRKIKL
ncbi:PGF-pre-PGF domain-containing protein [Candidatus Undinarchaeota archaeon]